MPDPNENSKLSLLDLAGNQIVQVAEGIGDVAGNLVTENLDLVLNPEKHIDETIKAIEGAAGAIENFASAEDKQKYFNELQANFGQLFEEALQQAQLESAKAVAAGTETRLGTSIGVGVIAERISPAKYLQGFKIVCKVFAKVGKVRGKVDDLLKEAVKADETAFEKYMRELDNLDVSTSRNNAVFYSGPGNRANAELFALQNGKTTLEMTPGGKWLDEQQLFSPDSPLTPGEATEVWSNLSQKYAEGASGGVVGFVENARPNSIFNSVEYPALQMNPNITNVITGGH
jgi:hypothetical protein